MDFNFDELYYQQYYFVIKVINQSREVVELLRWDDMRFEVYCKWSWYFKYRAALLQVKYPKFDVVLTGGKEPAVGRTREQLLKNKVISKKAQLSKFKNKLKKFEDSYNELFPITEREDYIKCKEIIKKLEIELNELKSNI